MGNARSPGNNRSVSVAGDRVFMQTDSAHLIALNRFTGQVLWDTEMADYQPELQRHRLHAGGGESGDRRHGGRRTGRARDFWRPTTRRPEKRSGASGRFRRGASRARRPGTASASSTAAARHGSPEVTIPKAKTIYWPTGNAGPDFNGDNRKGDNLYTCSIVALDVTTGKLKWHYQTTPHDEWDWDAVQPVLLVDANWQGKPRKLLLQANRNGFFYVLDRTDGKLLLAKPLVKKLTWAKEIGADGRPVMNPNQTAQPWRER